MRCASGAAAVFLLAASALAADHAVLIATSKTFENYRHQADVSHAYQILTAGGVPKENIIVMMYDDIAHNEQNPFPGKLFNKPTAAGVAGQDVYAGVNIDYRGDAVTSENFVSVITGNTVAMKGKGTGRVLASGATDRVFINMVDHGAPGFVAFPNYWTSGDKLTRETLLAALKTMQQKGMYEELVFYLEACESGSMFEDLPADLKNVYATTAANAKESSKAAYCPPNAMVDGKSVGTCLGDAYSVNWMQNADAQDLGTETLQQQYTAVKAATTGSHVTQFGSTVIAQEPAGNFEGNVPRANATLSTPAGAMDMVDARDVGLVYRFDRYIRAVGADRSAAAAALTQEVSEREAADRRFGAIAAAAVPGRQLDAPAPLTHRACHHEAHRAVDQHCGGYTAYSLKYARTMVNACEALHGNATAVVAAVRKVCV